MINIDVNSVDFSYGDLPVIRGVSFSVHERDAFAVMGPSGSGKSTLFRLLAALERPTSGRITRDGALVERPSADVRLGFQDHDGFPWATVEKNLRVIVRLAGPRETISDRVDGLLADVGLTEYRELYPDQLSGGMRKRLALARALAGSPKLALLDEPFASLDLDAREELQELLQRLSVSKETAFGIITHDVEEAVFLARRILICSARPLELRDEVEVNLPFPRDVQTRRSREFRDECARVRAALTQAASERRSPAVPQS
jgi:NitT/TauT family transport system ATP-binding protein